MVRRVLWIAAIVSVFFTTSTLGLPQLLDSISIRGHLSRISPHILNIFQRSLDTGKDISNQGFKLFPTTIIKTKNSMSRPIRRMGSEFLGKRGNLIVSDKIQKENGSKNYFTENMSFRGKQKEKKLKSVILRKRNIQPYHNKNNIFRILLSNNYGGDLFGKRVSYVLPNSRFHDDSVGSEFLGKRGITGSGFFGKRGITGSEFSGKRGFTGSEFLGKRGFTGSEFLGKRGFTGSEFLGKRGITGSEFFGKGGITGSEFLGKRGITGSEFLGKRGITGSEFLGKRGITGSEFLGKRGIAGSESLGRKFMEHIFAENEYKMMQRIYNDRQNCNVYCSAKLDDADGSMEMQTIHKSLPINEKFSLGMPTKIMNAEPKFLVSKRGMGSEFLEKRGMGSEFLGKRGMGSEFLGKRRVGAEFLGKRKMGSNFINDRLMGSQFSGNGELRSAFHGKRRYGSKLFVNKGLGYEFLGKRSTVLNEKRGMGSESLRKRALEKF